MALFRNYFKSSLSLIPPSGAFARLLTKILLYIFLAASVFFLFPHEKSVYPGGSIFSIFVLYMFSEFFGVITKQLFFLPSLVGMICAGIFVSNVGFFQYHVHHHISSSLRNIAFIALLVRAGLELDTESLLKMKRVCILLSFVPGVCAESPVVAATTRFFLGIPWGWSFMIGFIMAAVSPAIVVACILKLQAKGYGTAKGIPTLVIASSSVDDIVAICCFSVAMTVTFASGSIVWVICKAPIEFAAGALPAALIGALFWYLPSHFDAHKTYLRYSLLFLSCITVFFGAESLKAHGTGALFAITLGFVASRKWGTAGNTNSGENSEEDSHNDVEEVEKAYAISWRYLAPLLFALIGAELKFDDLEVSIIGLSIIIVTLGVLARLLAAYVCCIGVGLNWREKVFVSISSIPKATVQAAIGSVPLDFVREMSQDEYAPEYEKWAKQILAIAVVSVIMTAPLGAVLTQLSGPFLLTKDSESETDKPEDEETKMGLTDETCTCKVATSGRKRAPSVHEDTGQKILDRFSINNHVEV